MKIKHHLVLIGLILLVFLSGVGAIRNLETHKLELNIGQFTCNLYGVNYFEGTGVWSNNSQAIDTIFPHCEPTRKHYVF